MPLNHSTGQCGCRLAGSIILVMDDAQERADEGCRSDAPLVWFWIGAGLGMLVSIGTVVFATEFTRKRYHRGKAGYDQDEIDLVDDLTDALTEGMHVLAAAAEKLERGNFGDASRERIRYGLDPGRAGAGSSGWYTGEEDD